ncbi:hypothetical protein Clacol_000600 [Clathrus columnatus]|uniref:COG complex component COG2 C-terminal domain-containing protein n=1 Tax=Clathrus columnatus TaxID=1419009 RepID=A0AAV4ZZG4_9AGAM|nr:hypothetical protein Clacol_000600 [Clathrus columnatus]
MPVAPADTSNENIAIEDITLSQCGVVVSDIKTLERRVIEFWTTHISVILSESEEEPSSSLVILKQSFKRALGLIPILGGHVISILTRRCCENLVAVRSVPSQYRALPNKRMPVAPSPFISDVLKPIRTFLTIHDSLKDNPGSQWITEIFRAICTRKTEESLRRLKRGKISAFPLFGSSKTSSQDVDGKEEERVRAQMILDVTALGNDARELGVDINQDNCFQELKAMASVVGKFFSRICEQIKYDDVTIQDIPL